MKHGNLLINAILAFSLLFCLAFACNDGNEQKSGTTESRNDRPTAKKDNARQTRSSKSDESADDEDTVTEDGDSEQETSHNGIGAKYGSRDPRTCGNKKAPASGAMTDELATKYAICESEGEKDDLLYLVEGVKTQVGGAVPYSSTRFPYDSDIDVEAPVYPLRVTAYKQYQCKVVTEDNQGKNCTVYPHDAYSGVCVKTTFGDWRCTLDYQSGDNSKIEWNAPPPQ